MTSRFSLAIGLVTILWSSVVLSLPREEDDDRFNDWKEIYAEEYRDLVDPDGATSQEEEEASAKTFLAVNRWSAEQLSTGEMSGVATDHSGLVSLLQRGEMHWTDGLFDEKHVFTKKNEGPIKAATVLTLNSSSGLVVDRRGENLFYLPHGLTIDHLGNKWITDVAMHQVFKFEANKQTPSLTLGKLFEPATSGKDVDRFCQPTDVAVSSTGDIYVSDGYCASRVLKFDASGKFLRQFAEGDAQIPHSLALLEDLDLICVADREGMRVLCYNAGIKNISRLGEPEREYADDLIGRVYAIAYNKLDGSLYGVSGQTGFLPAQGFAIDMNADVTSPYSSVTVWSPASEEGLRMPHDIAVSRDGLSLFVIETDGASSSLWQFVREKEE